MSTYRQSFPSFAAWNYDIPTGLFARATFQNCTFTFGSSCGMNSVSDPSSSSTLWKRALLDSTPPCGKFQKKRYILESDSSDDDYWTLKSGFMQEFWVVFWQLTTLLSASFCVSSCTKIAVMRTENHYELNWSLSNTFRFLFISQIPSK